MYCCADVHSIVFYGMVVAYFKAILTFTFREYNKKPIQNG